MTTLLASILAPCALIATATFVSVRWHPAWQLGTSVGVGLVVYALILLGGHLA